MTTERSQIVVGLTYDLREEQQPSADAPPDYYGEFDSEENIDHLQKAINRLGYSVTCIGNARKLAQFLAAGNRVDIVFNMAEGIWGRSREGQVPAILEAFDIPYTGCDALSASLCLDKVMAKRLWLQQNVATAPFAVVNTLSDCEAVFDLLPDTPLFAKPAQEGSSKGITHQSVIHTLDDLRQTCQHLLTLYKQPVLVEPYLPGREFTVGVIGTGETAYALGTAEVRATTEGNVSGFFEKEQWEDKTTNYYSRVEPGDLRDKLHRLALAAYRALGCRDIGRVDVRCDENGEPYVLEINPIPAMHPTHSAMCLIGRYEGMSYEDLIGAVIQHSLNRWQSRFKVIS